MAENVVKQAFKEAKTSIQDFKDKLSVDNDTIRYKEIIKETLYSDPRILFLLNNPTLEEEMLANDELDGSIYVGKNILPYYFVPTTETKIKNYVCYDCSFKEIPKYNTTDKYGLIMFQVMCELDDVDCFGMSRHDVISQVIIDIFNWSHLFDTQIHLISDQPTTVDMHYAARTLVFEYTKPNSILQTRREGSDLVSKIVNKRKNL